MKRLTFLVIFSAALVATVFVATRFGPGTVDPAIAQATHASMATPF